MVAILGDSFGQKFLTLLSTALALHAWTLYQQTHDLTPLLLSAVVVFGVLDTGVTVRAIVKKKVRPEMKFAAARVAYYFVLIVGIAVRQVT